MQSFVIIANLIRSLSQFDTMFEVKLVTHFVLASAAASASQAQQSTSILMTYAALFYNLLMNPSAATQSVLNNGSTVSGNNAAINSNNQVALIPLKRLINEGVLMRLVQSV